VVFRSRNFVENTLKPIDSRVLLSQLNRKIDSMFQVYLDLGQIIFRDQKNKYLFL